jgi:hypothetical protein
MRTVNACRYMLLMLAVSAAPGLAAEPAGRLVYSHGEVAIRGSDGQPREVGKGAAVAAGDTVVTGSGRTHVAFADGGFIAVQPNTQFRVDEYNYAGKEDGSERSFFALIKGGIRFISGTIGHRNKENYKIRTTVATIGIRGSAGRLEICEAGSCGNLPDGAYLTGNQDTLTLTNSTGTTDVGVGQTFHTSCNTCEPKQVRQAPGAYAALNGEGGGDNETAEEPGFMAGQQVDENGNPLAVAGFEIPSSIPVTGTGSYFISGVPATLTATGEGGSSFFTMTTDVVLDLNFATGGMTGFIAGDYDDGEIFFQFLADATGGNFTATDRSSGVFGLSGDPANDAGCLGGPCGFSVPTALSGSSTYAVSPSATQLDGSYTLSGVSDSGDTIVIEGGYVAPQDTAAGSSF